MLAPAGCKAVKLNFHMIGEAKKTLLKIFGKLKGFAKAEDPLTKGKRRGRKRKISTLIGHVRWARATTKMRWPGIEWQKAVGRGQSGFNRVTVTRPKGKAERQSAVSGFDDKRKASLCSGCCYQPLPYRLVESRVQPLRCATSHLT